MISRKHKNIVSDHSVDQMGFTIVELMVATLVFSMVLVVILYGVLNFSRAYYSGVNSTATQNAARTVIDDVSQSIQFSGNVITPTTLDTNPPGPTNVPANAYYFCSGGATYYFVLGAMYTGSTPSITNPGLYEAPGSCTPSPSFTAGRELLGTNMRVTYLSLQASLTNARLYTIGLALSYGDSDILCRTSLGSSTGGCQVNAAPNSAGQSVVGNSIDDVQCKQEDGSQFCAQADLSTTVSLRVGSSELAP